MDEVVIYRRAALVVYPSNHPHHSVSLNKLSTALLHRFRYQGRYRGGGHSQSYIVDFKPTLPVPHVEIQPN